MEIYSEPYDYQAVGNEIMYGITGVNAENTIDVEIRTGKDRKTVGIKRFRGETAYQVNVAGYLRGAVQVEPCRSGKTEIITPEKRTVEAGISVGNLNSQQTFFTAGTKDASIYKKLSDAPHRTEIAQGECDEIAWFAPQSEATIQIRFSARKGDDLQIVLDTVTCQDGMSVLLIDADHLASQIALAGRNWNEFNTMEVNIILDDETAFTQQYVMRKHQGEKMRICWANQYGAVDYYTFNACAKQQMAIDKNKMDGQNGIEVLNARAESRYTLVSEYEPRNVMRWIAGAAAAKNVWCVQLDPVAGESMFMPVDVVTDQVVLHEEGKLERMEITIRPTCKTKYGL